MSAKRRTESRRPGFDDGDLALEVVDRYPHAILVQDRAGGLVACNAAAQRMLDGLVPLAPGTEAGCRALGCRAPGSPLEGICAQQRALVHDGPLPSLRVGLPDGGPAVTATVTALGDDLVLTELRHAGPAAGGASGRAGAPPWAPGPQLRLFVLGRTCVMNGDRVLEGRWLNNRAGHILKLLIAERHAGAFSDEIVARLWPGGASPDTRGLRYFVHVLREQLEPDGSRYPPSSFVTATRGGYALNGDRVWIDADAFEELVSTGLAAHAVDDAGAEPLLRRGMELYRGEFLADEPYAEWALHERDRLRDIAGQALRTLAALDERKGDLARATAALVRLAELEPFDVDVHRALFALLLRRGRRSEALRRYETLRRWMLSTFDERLDFSLSQLG